MQDCVLEEIKKIAMKYKVRKAILFGSRARNDHSSVSDYDIAIIADSLSPFDKACFCDDVEEIKTLKKIDIVFLDNNTSDELMANITKDGIDIYEQIENEIK